MLPHEHVDNTPFRSCSDRSQVSNPNVSSTCQQPATSTRGRRLLKLLNCWLHFDSSTCQKHLLAKFWRRTSKNVFNEYTPIADFWALGSAFVRHSAPDNAVYLQRLSVSKALPTWKIQRLKSRFLICEFAFKLPKEARWSTSLFYHYF